MHRRDFPRTDAAIACHLAGIAGIAGAGLSVVSVSMLCASIEGLFDLPVLLWLWQSLHVWYGICVGYTAITAVVLLPLAIRRAVSAAGRHRFGVFIAYWLLTAEAAFVAMYAAGELWIAMAF